VGSEKTGSDEPRQKNFQKTEKSFEKGIDKAKSMWYNRKVDAQKARRRMIFEN